MGECNCMNKVRIPGENMPDSGTIHLWGCPALKAHWFYYEDAVDAWVTLPDDIEIVIGGVYDDRSVDPVEIKFKRLFMSDDELNSLPEC